MTAWLSWSRVIRIENEARAGRYPRTLHALVFDLAGILWFYTDADGTQSFSLHSGRLAEEKADFGPLLRDIEAGFVRWSEVPPGRRASPALTGELRNGCFIESVAELRVRLARGDPMERPRLLSYYEETPLGRRGHTVLVFGLGDHLEVFDPSRPQERRMLAKEFGHDALALARVFESSAVVKARYVAIDFSVPLPDGMVATAGTGLRESDAKPDRS